MKTNKIVVEELTAYFLTQDRGVVSRLLAALLIDCHRICHIQNLGSIERDCLVERMRQNAEAVYNFSVNGPDGDLKVTNMESVESGDMA